MAELDLEGLWNETLSRLQNELGEEEFSGWFTDVKYLYSSENSIAVGFPSSFHRDRIKTRYLNKIKSIIKELGNKDIKLDLEVIQDNKKEIKTVIKDNPDNNLDNKPKDNALNSFSEPDKEPPVKKPQRGQHPQLLDNYTFEKYIIGENNNFAANAAIAISRNPGNAYNPFFIYGGVGLGKTHLMQAIGNYIYENSDNKVIYVTSEEFMNEYVQGCIRGGSMSAFRNKFRHTDVLLIDDIQFFQERGEAVKEELFHTFNSLLMANRQLVMTCDRPPAELKKIPDRLISRFNRSLLVDLQPPRYEVRYAILKSTADNRSANIPDEVIDLISKNISSNVRDLLGALEKLISYTEIMGKPVTLEIAQQKLRDIFGSRRQANLSIENIQKVVSDYFSLSLNDLKGKRKNQKVVYPRQLAMYICREMTDFSTTEIGEAFGGRDHTTVMYSIEKIRGLLITDPMLDSTIENFKRQIKEISTK